MIAASLTLRAASTKRRSRSILFLNDRDFRRSDYFHIASLLCLRYMNIIIVNRTVVVLKVLSAKQSFASTCIRVLKKDRDLLLAKLTARHSIFNTRNFKSSFQLNDELQLRM
jgi:hypothetical protein